MFHEVTVSRQVDGRYRRRWFQGDQMDLFVWSDATGRIVRFQLSYDKHNREMAIDWKYDRGFVHARVGGDLPSPGRFGSPLLTGGVGEFAKQRVLTEFAQYAANLDPNIKLFVLHTMRKYHDQAAYRRLKKQILMAGGLIGGILLAWKLWK